MGESTLQRACCGYARKYRVLARKVHCEGRRGWPDLALIFPVSGETVYIEMKNPNGKGVLAKLQAVEQAKLKAQGAAVYNCYTLKSFIRVLHTHLQKKGAHS